MILKKHSNSDANKENHFQFICDLCGEGFNQKSSINSHMELSHPSSAPIAADLEKLLSEINYPLSKERL